MIVKGVPLPKFDVYGLAEVDIPDQVRDALKLKPFKAPPPTALPTPPELYLENAPLAPAPEVAPCAKPWISPVISWVPFPRLKLSTWSFSAGRLALDNLIELDPACCKGVLPVFINKSLGNSSQVVPK